VLIWSSTGSASRFFFRSSAEAWTSYLRKTEFVIEPVTEHQARLARQGLRRLRPRQRPSCRAELRRLSLVRRLALDTREAAAMEGATSSGIRVVRPRSIGRYL